MVNLGFIRSLTILLTRLC